MKIRITKHAKERVVQRFRLFMYSFEIDKPEIFLEREFKDSYRDMRIDQCPFYKNKLVRMFGEGSFFSVSKNLIFMCNEQNGEIIIRTVIKWRDDWSPFNF